MRPRPRRPTVKFGERPANPGPSGISKCKARQNISVLEGDDEVTALGNDAANERAKAALTETDLTTGSQKRSSKPTIRREEAGELGEKLAEWPTTHRLFEELEKAKLLVDNRDKFPKRQHCFNYVDERDVQLPPQKRRRESQRMRWFSRSYR